MIRAPRQRSQAPAVPPFGGRRFAVRSAPRARSGLAFAARALLAAAVLALGPSGCERADDFTQQRLYSMGTWVDVTLEAPEAAASAALTDVEKVLRGFERDYYAWADGGELARINEALAAGREITVSDEMAAVLRKAQQVSAASGDAFDPAVGALVELWGFHSELERPTGPPPAEAIEAWRRSRGTMADIRIDGRQVSSENPHIKLDLGGIAKGEAVDRAIELLRRHGVQNALVNAGGNLRAIGSRGRRAWRVGIQAPRGDGLLGSVELRDGECASTSGDYERYFEQNGHRLHHLLDPRTGHPVEDTEAVTVITSSGVDADAASTALFVAGRAEWRNVARALGITLALRVDASGEIEVTEALARRLEKAPGTADVVVVGREGGTD
jgi:thiamine biosynthesis lipoprotein